uniref:Uncharacterized protein n=1 Tax=uncultured Desulfobacterium sp. TaxID=201089 RepID=E1YE05_9BACT|nr:hypothetical protein N47_B20810 [uncultured Desulfobacterium sp.]
MHAPAWGATNLNTECRTCRFVSIHAPAWGATLILPVKLYGWQVSIHAPAWGATDIGSKMYGASRFQSTRPHGARRSASCPDFSPLTGFNPRARMGRDLLLMLRP